MIRRLLITALSVLSVPYVLWSQTPNTAIMLQGSSLVPTNAATVLSNALGLGPFATNTSLEITNISGLQAALGGKLATNGVAQAAIILTNSTTGERVVLEEAMPGVGGRLAFYANQSQDPFIWLVAPPKTGESYPTYMSIGVRNGQGFLATSSNGPVGMSSSSVRIETYGGGLTKLWAKELLLSGGGINAPQATGTASTNVANVGTLDNRYAPKPKYAVFTLDLGDNYTDFELKATTNNWSGGGMVWFYHSPDPAKAVIWQQIWTVRPDVYFTDSQYVKSGDANMNQRTWRKQSASQSIAAMRSNANSVVGSVTVVIGDTGGAISPTNRSLIFSWCRMTPTGPESDATGRSIWRTARPEWVAEIPIITQ